MKKSNDDIPQYIIDELAKMILPEILKFYESDKSKIFSRVNIELCKSLYPT